MGKLYHELYYCAETLHKCMSVLSHVTLCNPMYYSTPGFSVHGISQARIGSELPFPSPGEASLIAQLVKNPPAMLETTVGFLGWEDPLEKG